MRPPSPFADSCHDAHPAASTARVSLILLASSAMLLATALRLPVPGWGLPLLVVIAVFAAARLTPMYVAISLVFAALPLMRVFSQALYWGLRLTVADFFLAFAALVWLWAKADGRPVCPWPAGARKAWRLNILLLGYLMVAVISAAIAWGAGRGDVALPLELAKILLLCLYVFLTCAALTESGPDPRVFLPWLCVAIIESALATVSVALIPSGIRLPYLYGKRGCGTMVDPNAFAAYMSASFFLALGLAASARRDLLRAISMVAVAACLLGLAAAASLGGFVAFAVAATALAALAAKEKALRRILGCAVAGSLLLGVLAVVSTKDNLVAMALSRLGLPDDDPLYRLGLWRTAIRTLFEHPLFGVGRGGFLMATGSLPHNTFLGIAAELGLSGLLFFVAIMMRAGYVLLAKDGGFARPLRLAMACAILALLIQGLAINIENARFLWIAVGLAACAEREARAPA